MNLVEKYAFSFQELVKTEQQMELPFSMNILHKLFRKTLLGAKFKWISTQSFKMRLRIPLILASNYVFIENEMWDFSTSSSMTFQYYK